MRNFPKRGGRYLLAPNAFKGSLSATQAARAMAIGVRRSGGTPVLLPLADGGDGTLDVLRKPLGLRLRQAKVLDPRCREISAAWGYNKKTRLAVIEMARASGLALLKSDECRRPLETTSYGTGQLIHAAVRSGAKVILLGLGGSATVDGGLGLLQALGAKITVQRARINNILERPAKGRDLLSLHSIDATAVGRTLKGVRIRVLCDVRNPLLGPRGAARAFGPQKGATPTEVRFLERGLARLAAMLHSKRKDISKIAGAGAAGGAATGLVGLTNARLESGAESIFKMIELEEHVQQADVVITGEGRIDRTSWEGKGLGHLLSLCRRHNKPLIALAGGIGPGGRRLGVRLQLLGNDRMSQKEKIQKARFLIENAVLYLTRRQSRLSQYRPNKVIS